MNKQIKKIIGFDSWTGGASHYQRLLPALDARSMQLTVVHIGSWGNEPGCPREVRMGDLLVRDISYYGGNSIEKVLDFERPDAAILLSVDTFAHRAFIRYCRQRAIPTLNLYHGLVAGSAGHYTADSDGQTGGLTFSRVAHVKYVFSKIGKLIKYTFPCYVGALLKTKATHKDWGKFILDVFRLAIGADLQVGRAAADAKTTKCAVYVKEDAEHAIHCYGFLERDVFVVGNPDLIAFGMEQSIIGQWRPPVTHVEKSILYIETGYSSVGVFFSGTTAFVNHLIDTSNSLSAQGYKMRLKLKPNQINSKSIEQGLAETQIELVTNEKFLQSLMECSACIVEATSLAMLPALMGMPLLLAKYGDLKSLSFGSVLTGYPRSYLLQDISNVSSILIKDTQTSDSGQVNDWIDLNVGPKPPHEMPERVAAIVNEMIAAGSQ